MCAVIGQIARSGLYFRRRAVHWIAKAATWFPHRIAPPRRPGPAPRVSARKKAATDRSAIPIHHVGTPAVDEEASPPAQDETYADYELPPLTLLQDSQPPAHQEHEQVLRERAALLEKTFADFNLNVRVVGIHTGPVITQYEVALETGLRVTKVTSWQTIWP